MYLLNYGRGQKLKRGEINLKKVEGDQKKEGQKGGIDTRRRSGDLVMPPFCIPEVNTAAGDNRELRGAG